MSETEINVDPKLSPGLREALAELLESLARGATVDLEDLEVTSTDYDTAEEVLKDLASILRGGVTVPKRTE